MCEAASSGRGDPLLVLNFIGSGVQQFPAELVPYVDDVRELVVDYELELGDDVARLMHGLRFIRLSKAPRLLHTLNRNLVTFVVSATLVDLGLEMIPSLVLESCNLVQLDVSRNCIAAIPSGCFTYARSLRVLKLSQNALVSLDWSSLPKTLRLLDVSSNRLSRLPDLFPLNKIRLLKLDDNRFESIPMSVRSLPLLDASWTGNPLRGLPRSVVAGGLADVWYFLRDLEWCSSHSNPLKIVIHGTVPAWSERLCGNLCDSICSAGLVSRGPLQTGLGFVDPTQSDGLLVRSFAYGPVEFKVVAVGALFEPVFHVMVSPHCIVLVYFDVDDPDFPKLDSIVSSVFNTSPTCVLVLVGVDKSTTASNDHASSRAALEDSLRGKLLDRFAAYSKSIAGVHFLPLHFPGAAAVAGTGIGSSTVSGPLASGASSTSSLNRRLLEQQRRCIAAYDVVRSTLVTGGLRFNSAVPVLYWYFVPFVLNARESDKGHIAMSEFIDFAATLGFTSATDLIAILRWLVKTGYVVYADEDRNIQRLRSLFLVLNPWWLGYAFLSFRQSSVYAKSGIVDHSKLHYIWPLEIFPISVQRMLAHLMVKFDVMHPLPPSVNPNTGAKTRLSVVPSLLPPRDAVAVQSIWPVSEPPGVAPMRRSYDFGPLPLSFYGRLLSNLSNIPLLQLVAYWDSGFILRSLRRNSLRSIAGQADATAAAAAAAVAAAVVAEPPSPLAAQSMMLPSSSSSVDIARVEFNPSLFRLTVDIRAAADTDDLAVTLMEALDEFVNQWFRLQLRRPVWVFCSHCLASHSYDPFKFSLADLVMAVSRDRSANVLCRNVTPVTIASMAPDVVLSKVRQVQRRDIVYAEEDLLGAGSFGSVYFGTVNLGTLTMDVAVKAMAVHGDDLATDGDRVRMFSELRREVTAMCRVKHPALVQFVAMCVTDQSLYLLTEFVRFGDLYGFLRRSSRAREFSSCDRGSSAWGSWWTYALRVASDVAFGMRALHSANPPMMHNDLKSPNILLADESSTAAVVAKVSDFGLSAFSSTGLRQQRAVFNPTWLAPEAMGKDVVLSPAVDVYSYGIILWELAHPCQEPFDSYNVSFTSELEHRICDDDLRPQISERCPEPWRDLMVRCWAPDPANRPSFSCIVDDLLNMRTVIAPKLPHAVLLSSMMNANSDRAEAMPAVNLESSGVVPEARRDSISISVPGSISMEGMSLITGKNVGCVGIASHMFLVWACYVDGTLMVWDARSRSIRAHAFCVEPASCLTVADGATWVGSQTSGIITVFDGTKVMQSTSVEILRPSRTLRCKMHAVTCVRAFRSYVLVCGIAMDGRCVIEARNQRNGRRVSSVALPNNDIGNCMLPVGDTIWVGTRNHIYTINADKFIVEGRSRQRHEDHIHALIRVDDTVWSCSSDKSIGIWNLSGVRIASLLGHYSRVLDLLLRGDQVWSCGWDKTILVWNRFERGLINRYGRVHEDSIIGFCMPETESEDVWVAVADGTLGVYRDAGDVRSDSEDVDNNAPSLATSTAAVAGRTRRSATQARFTRADDAPSSSARRNSREEADSLPDAALLLHSRDRSKLKLLSEMPNLRRKKKKKKKSKDED
jgi:serine/threonine protein kinase